MWAAKIKLDEKAYGKGLSWLYKLGWYWCFFAMAQKKKEDKAELDDDDGSNFVTIEDSFLPVLVAVTQKQLKGWAKQGMKYKHHWRWVNCVLMWIHTHIHTHT